MKISNIGLGRFFARQILGLIFFMAGWWKCFDLTPLKHAEMMFVRDYAENWIPEWLLWITGTSIPVIELVGGGLLIFGLFRKPALIGLGIVLILVTYGHLLHEALFVPTSHIFPRTVLLIAIFALPEDKDIWSLDQIILNRSSKREDR